MTEVAPGIHRIESTLGPRPFSQYLLWGERTLLVDTGIASTPDEVILPFFREKSLDPTTLDLVLLSHADVDHFGGNWRMREAAPRALFCAHELDSDWMSNRELILRERYGWYAEHGPSVDYDHSTKDFLASAMGAGVAIDVRLRAGERLRISPRLTVDVLSLPGHSDGHIGLWDSASRTAIVIDAILGGGLLDMEGRIIHPPPYFSASAYEETITRVRGLQPQLLLTAHFSPMGGSDVVEFLDLSQAFVSRARGAVRSHLRKAGAGTLGELLPVLADELGPFSSFTNELAGPIRAHLGELVAAGEAEVVHDDAVPTWRWTG